MSAMSLLLNVLWIVFGGLWMAVAWLIAAVTIAVTIIGLRWTARRSTSLPILYSPSANRPCRALNSPAAET